MLTQVMCYASQKKKKKVFMQFFLVRTWYLGSAQCMGMTQRPNLSTLVNREPVPNNRLYTMPTKKLATYTEWILLGTVVPWEKSPVENQSTTGESFKMVTSVLKNGSHLVRNLFQKGPTHLKSFPTIMTIPLREVYNQGKKGRVKGGFGKLKGERDTRENCKE